MTRPVQERHERQLRRYGITEATYQAMWTAVDGHCPICTKPFSSNRLACIDHDHETGQVRGLLCTACNYFIGETHDDAAKLRRAADYLTDPYPWGWVPGSIGEVRNLRLLERVEDSRERYGD